MMIRSRSFLRAFMILFLLAFTAIGANEAQAQGAFTLTTPQTQNNGQAGVSFTIEAVNTIKVWRIGANTDGGSQTMEVFYKAGASAVGTSQFATTGWTKAGSASVTMGTNTNTQIPIDIDLIIPQGETYSFVVCCASSTAMNYTTGGTGITTDANIKINGNGWGGGYNASAGITPSFNPRGYNGAVYYDFAGSKWVGTNSSDWNDQGNWDNDEVPDKDASVIIPNAATTANDCVIPAGAECKGVKLEANGILVGDVGTLDIYGDWVNEGGTFVPGTSVINYLGDEKAVITTGGSTVGNINIMKDSALAKINVTDSWTSAQDGTFAADINSVIEFDDPVLDFSATTFDNKGLIKLGLTGGGTAAATQDITGGAINLGRVEVNVIDLMDTVTFLSDIGFDDLLVKGAGTIFFVSSADISTRFETTMDGALTVTNGIIGDADLYFNSVMPLTLGNVIAGSIQHINEGSITLGATVLSREANFLCTGPATQATITGGLDVGGNLDVDAATVGTVAVTINGALSVGGIANFTKGNVSVTGVLLSTGEVNFLADGFVDFGAGISTADTLSFNGLGALTVGGGIQVNDLNVSNAGDFSVAGNLQIRENMLDDGTGNFEVSGSMVVDGTIPQTLSSSSSRPLNNGRIIVQGPEATFSGAFNASQTGAANPAFEVQNGGGALLVDGALIQMGAAGQGTPFARIDGSLSTTSGASALRPIIAGQLATADHGKVEFRSGSSMALNGIVFQNIGSDSEAYAIEIHDGSNVLSFNYITVTGANSTVAAIQLSEDSLPNVILEFECSGSAPSNIDASSLSGFTVEIKKSQTGAGNLYGVPNEIDPNGVLFWEDPPVLDILSNGTIPNVLAETSFSEQLSGTGGNQPLAWTLLNAPTWMSIGSTTGEITGTPPRTAVGIHTFVVFISDSTTPALTASKIFKIVVDALVDVPVNIITPDELLPAQVDKVFSYSLSAAGGTGQNFVWEVLDINDLPPGITLRPDGVLFGTPSEGASGVYSFDVRATDSQGNSSIKNYSMTVKNEFNDPATINAALGDGGTGGGGCALSSGNVWMLYLLAGLMMLFAIRGVVRKA